MGFAMFLISLAIVAGPGAVMAGDKPTQSTDQMSSSQSPDSRSPDAKTEATRRKAQDFPSTRNAENPDPSIGGTNSATGRSDAPVPAGPTTSAPNRSRNAGR